MCTHARGGGEGRARARCVCTTGRACVWHGCLDPGHLRRRQGVARLKEVEDVDAVAWLRGLQGNAMRLRLLAFFTRGGGFRRGGGRGGGGGGREGRGGEGRRGEGRRREGGRREGRNREREGGGREGGEREGGEREGREREGGGREGGGREGGESEGAEREGEGRSVSCLARGRECRAGMWFGLRGCGACMQTQWQKRVACLYDSKSSLMRSSRAHSASWSSSVENAAQLLPHVAASMRPHTSGTMHLTADRRASAHVFDVSVVARRTTQLHSRGWRIRGGPPGGAAGGARRRWARDS